LLLLDARMQCAGLLLEHREHRPVLHITAPNRGGCSGCSGSSGGSGSGSGGSWQHWLLELVEQAGQQASVAEPCRLQASLPVALPRSLLQHLQLLPQLCSLHVFTGGCLICHRCQSIEAAGHL
jgi:hypothetical protein